MRHPVNRHPDRLQQLAYCWVALCILLAFLLGGCQPRQPAHVESQQDPAWATLVHSHTSGLMSRHSSIRIVFQRDVVSAAQVGSDALDVVSVSPATSGVATFTSTREITFKPQRTLVPRKKYTVSVASEWFKELPANTRPFTFGFEVKQPDYDVSFGGLTAAPADGQSLIQSGALITADREDSAAVEQLLAARYSNKPVAITWRHPSAERHVFTIGPIKRESTTQSLLVSWNGVAIGAKTEGIKQIEIPMRDRFIVTQLRASEDQGERIVTVFFSDTLDARQNLKGLVRATSGDVQTRVEGNVLKVYSAFVEGDVTVTIEPSVRNQRGATLSERVTQTVTFRSLKPQVRFVGSGVILPSAATISVPFEAVNVRSVQVTAFRIYEDNVRQFLQVNALDGAQELGRVGRYLWRKQLSLNATDSHRWQRYSLDLTELMQKNPDGLVRLTLAIGRGDSTFECADTAPMSTAREALVDQEQNDLKDASNWDYAEDYYAVGDSSDWSDRENPCKDAYYRYAPTVRSSRNFMPSNIGLLAKRDQQGKWLIVVTDLRTAQPFKNVQISALNYQGRTLAIATSNDKGMAELTLAATPFVIAAQAGRDRGYLKVQPGLELPVSHFDVGGEKVSVGLKGFIYGERGVWRPGDDIYLTFVIEDKNGSLPPNHPATLEFYNPQSQLVQSVTNASPVKGFYAFTLKTPPDAPTGDWTAKVTLGGAVFSKVLKIETVMPNRLKIALDMSQSASGALETVQRGEQRFIAGKLKAEWLTGARANGLKADVQLKLSKANTHFDRFADYTFDDPAREFATQPQKFFEGQLDSLGTASFEEPLELTANAPGLLSATFTTRVFEKGGAFSTNYQALLLSPYKRYVGIRLPKGDVTRGMLRTDEDHVAEIATVDAEGRAVSTDDVEVTLYKIDWKWWWDQSGDSLARYASATDTSVMQQSKVGTRDGRGTWTFQVKYPEWGRFLIRACDVRGGHCTGKTFYIDWPSWAGRPQDQSGPAASVLAFTTDRERYSVGDTAEIRLPETTQGRALVTIENGSHILEAKWVELTGNAVRVPLILTRAMTPNAYVSVTLVQPHSKSNDRPLRLYGIVPIKVEDPESHLEPVVDVPDEWRPEEKVTVKVKEAHGRAMTYTLTVVDEGLLGLTNFKTPDLHAHFYKREALGVFTWDLYDSVAGSYSAEVERLLALGGSDVDQVKDADQRRSRFPPVVTYLGPFELGAGKTDTRELTLPQYLGQVRVMVVAGDHGAYGAAERAVFVRQPLMVLPTLPRVLGPDEEVTVPVSLFVSDASLSTVRVQLVPDKHFRVIGNDTTSLAFTKPDESIVFLKLKANEALGQGHIRVIATSAQERAQADVDLAVRSQNPETTEVVRKTLLSGEHWNTHLLPHGLPGSNAVSMEVSAVPALDLERRLRYLILYPYGCLEQTTSSVFPQLYLPRLVTLENERKRDIQANVSAAIHRLRGFQRPNGGFSYWPGGMFVTPENDVYLSWATSYAGHFLVEAEKLGYSVPDGMLNDWAKYQREAAERWGDRGNAAVLDQAYRLYTLALAGQPAVGAMNRLRENRGLVGPARWLLAAAYQLAGLSDAARDLVGSTSSTQTDESESSATLGSDLRNDAIVLMTASVLGRADLQNEYLQKISAALQTNEWYSTQTTAFALMAVSKLVGSGPANHFTFEQTIAGKRAVITADASFYNSTLKSFPDAGGDIAITNTSDRTLFVSIAVRGVPKAGDDTASASGLALDVAYVDADGEPIDVSKQVQGGDLITEILVTNTSPHRIDHIALSELVPAGWEIHNAGLEGVELEVFGARDPERKRQYWRWLPDGSPAATRARTEYIDIRDDRIYRHFSLDAGERIHFQTRINAAYRGRYYLPSIAAEAMYDASKHARSRGQWVSVVGAGE